MAISVERASRAAAVRRAWPRRRTLVVAALLGLGLLLAAAAGLGHRHRPTKPAAAAAPLTAVTAAPARRVVWAESIQASGPIAPWEEAFVASQLAGPRLVEVRVNVGDSVRRGEVLARFDDTMLRAQERELRAAVQQARAAAREAELNHERAVKLSAGGYISGQEAVRLATAAESAQAQVQVVQAQLAAKQVEIGYTIVHAPDDGLISERDATVGAVTGIGQNLFRLILQSRLEWRGELTASQLSRVSPGDRVELQLPDGRSADAVVRTTAPSLDNQSRLAVVYADLRGPALARAGMYATGHIAVGASPAVVAPAASVIVRDGRSYLFTLRQTPAAATALERPVTVGRRQGELVEIVQGLTAAEAVVVQGAAYLSNGDKVRLVATSPGG